MKTVQQTPEQKAASLAFSAVLRGQSKPNSFTVPFTREAAPPVRHRQTGRFISPSDVSDYLRREMLAKARPGRSADAESEEQEGGDGGSD